MRVEERFFEDFAVGETPRTLGRTITEADIVAVERRGTAP